jgi:hypothetical protein
MRNIKHARKASVEHNNYTVERAYSNPLPLDCNTVSMLL